MPFSAAYRERDGISVLLVLLCCGGTGGTAAQHLLQAIALPVHSCAGMLATLSCTMVELVSISTCTVTELATLGSKLDQLLACLEDTLGDLVWFVQLQGGQHTRYYRGAHRYTGINA